MITTAAKVAAIGFCPIQMMVVYLMIKTGKSRIVQGESFIIFSLYNQVLFNG